MGIFLPGDSLLFTAGFLASEGFLNIWVLIIGCVLAAVAGDGAGYYFGRSMGRRLYQRPDSRFFKQRHLRAAEAFYDRHGGKTIILARFVPIARTLAGHRRGQRHALPALRRLQHRGALLGGRRHAGRLPARQRHPRHRPLPAADHRRDRRPLGGAEHPARAHQPATRAGGAGAARAAAGVERADRRR
ncbi:MAG: VTT domain-containing protein [Dehalococcoidia bacterium]